MRGTHWALTAALALGLGASGSVARGADDDLSVVRKAVADARPGEVSAKTATPPARKGAEPQWLRVRVLDKKDRKTRVSVNLPLSLVKAFGSDWVLDGHCRRHKDEARQCLTLGEALRSLNSGQELVQVDDEDSTVRVWVE